MAGKKKKQRIDTLQSVELGDGVEILLRIAGPFPRAAALVIDYLIITGLLILLSFLESFISWMVGENYAEGLILICLFLLGWFYFSFFEWGKRGATPGKRVMGLRVVDRSGNLATKGQVMVRNLLRLVDMLPGVPTGALGMMVGGYGVGLAAMLLSKRFQRLGDVVANTVVVYAKEVAQPRVMAVASVGAIPPSFPLSREEQAAVVSFRERAGTWSEARRIELADHASELSGKNGAAGVDRLVGMAQWMSEGGGK